jgi:DNA-binding response OmpR family regulator
MSRILLVDDSPHAQRMGERILTEEGFEVVTVSTAESALIRADDVDPDVVIADTVMPGRNGFDICHYLKLSPRHRHTRVILTAGVLDPLDEEQIRRVAADSSLRKPFEASALLAAVKPLAESAAATRAQAGRETGPSGSAPSPPKDTAPFVAVVDSEQVRAAVAIALDAAMESMVEEISRRVVAVLAPKSSPTPSAESVLLPPLIAPPKPQEPQPAPPPPAVPHVETVRKVNPVRVRSASLLNLDLNSVDPPRSSES